MSQAADHLFPMQHPMDLHTTLAAVAALARPFQGQPRAMLSQMLMMGPWRELVLQRVEVVRHQIGPLWLPRTVGNILRTPCSTASKSGSLQHWGPHLSPVVLEERKMLGHYWKDLALAALAAAKDHLSLSIPAAAKDQQNQRVVAQGLAERLGHVFWRLA